MFRQCIILSRSSEQPNRLFVVITWNSVPQSMINYIFAENFAGVYQVNLHPPPPPASPFVYPCQICVDACCLQMFVATCRAAHAFSTHAIKACKAADLTWLMTVSHEQTKVWASNMLCYEKHALVTQLNLAFLLQLMQNHSFDLVYTLFCHSFSAGWARPHRETQGSYVRPACREEVADLLQQKEGRRIVAAACRLAANI